MSKAFDKWYEEAQERREQAEAEFEAAKEFEVDAYLEAKALKAYGQKWTHDALNVMGGAVVQAEEFSFKVDANSVVITKRAVGIDGVDYDKIVGRIDDPKDAHRIAEVMRMNTPLLKALGAAMNVVKTLDTTKTPETEKFYTETNYLLEMLKAKESQKV